MIAYILILVSLLLDGILSNFFPYIQNTLSWWTPLFTVTSIFFFYPMYRKKRNLYYGILFGTGVLYDLLYTNLLFFHGVIFVILGYFLYWMHKNFEVTSLRLLIYIPIFLFCYEFLTGSILWIFQVVPVTFSKILYKASHSILMNILYAEIIYFLLKIIPKKYKNQKING